MATYDVCIVGLKCLDMLDNRPVPRYLGGIEKQLVMLARSLRDQGMRVAFITYDHEGPQYRNIDEIHVYGSYSPDHGVPGIRFIYPRFIKLFRAVQKNPAKLIIQMGAGAETGIVALGAKLRWRPTRFVFLTASNADCELPKRKFRSYRERILYWIGMKLSDLVIAQTLHQKEMLRENHGIHSDVALLPVAVPKPRQQDSCTASKTKIARLRCLWLGRIVEVKRPHWLVHAAEQCPDIEFDVVGAANRSSEYSREVAVCAESLPNVRLHGKLSDENVAALYDSCDLLICTSEVEGFPTTFIEAWSKSLPVLTSFDPDGVVERNGLGIVFGTRSQMVDALKTATNVEYRKSTGEACKRYYDARYDNSRVANEFWQKIV